MIIVFYLIYVLTTNAHFSWLWLLIAIVMSIRQKLRQPDIADAIQRAIDEIKDLPKFRGPF